MPVAPLLGTLLTDLLPASQNAIPVLNGVLALVPSAKKALVGLPPVEKKATPAVKSLTGALNAVTPILAGLRPYTPDVVAGFFNGVGGAEGGSYDANGHYLKSELVIQPTGTVNLANLAVADPGLVGLLNLTNLVGPFNGARFQQLAPCPGGGGPPATDASNPWNSPDVLPNTGPPAICNPANNQNP